MVGHRRFDLRAHRAIEHASRLPDEPIQLRHVHLESGVIEGAALHRGQWWQRRGRQFWRVGDGVLDVAAWWPAAPAPCFRPIRQLDHIRQRGHGGEPEQPPPRPVRDLDGDACVQQAVEQPDGVLHGDAQPSGEGDGGERRHRGEPARTRPGVQDAVFQQGDAMALPYAEASFDIAVVALVVHFVPDPAKGVAEMARVVRRGGWVTAYVWDDEGGGSPTQPLQTAIVLEGGDDVRPPSSRASRMDRLLVRLPALTQNLGTAIAVMRAIAEEATFLAVIRRLPDRPQPDQPDGYRNSRHRGGFMRPKGWIASTPVPINSR